jgi:hypothetical protein
MNRLKFNFFVWLLILNLSPNQPLFCQSISAQSINSGATIMNQANGSLSFTVGELVILTQVDSEGNSLGSGFTSGATLTTATILEPTADILSVLVFPNPTSALLNVQINYAKVDKLILEIVDLQGKEVYSGTYSALTNTIGINTAQFQTGTYFLNLKDDKDEILGTYKLIKE